MSYRVTATQVRQRLKNLTVADITDATLEALAFIPTSEAEIDVMLSDSGITYSSLSTDKQTLVKAAEIAMTCQKIVTDSPEEIFKTGALDGKAITSKDKVDIASELEREWQRYLTLVGVELVDVYVSASTGDDYKPDGEDDTNVLWGDDDEDVVTVYP